MLALSKVLIVFIRYYSIFIYKYIFLAVLLGNTIIFVGLNILQERRSCNYFRGMAFLKNKKSRKDHNVYI